MDKEQFEKEVNRNIKAYGYSVEGLKGMWQDHQSFRTLCIVCGVLFFIALFLGEGISEKLILIGSLAMIIKAEIVNSALENLTDLVHPETSALAKKVKDKASASVFFTIILAIFAWLVIIIF